MAESQSHKSAKCKAAGKIGQIEIPLSGNRRLDASTRHRATEVEHSGTMENLQKAAQRLRDSDRKQKVLQVPHKDMDKAAKAMRSVGVSGTVKNMSSMKRRSVSKKK